MSQPVKSPIDYPRVTVGGVPYQIKFGFTSWIVLESWGLTKDVIREWFAGHRTTALTLSMAAAGLGTFDAAGIWQTADFTMTKLGDILECNEEEIPPLVEAVTVSLKKRLAEIESKKAATVPAQPSPSAP